MQDISTKNLVVESFQILDLCWSDKLTLEKVENAYNSAVKIYNEQLEQGIFPKHEIESILGAANYLIEFYQLSAFPYYTLFL
jgi:hypothetical protein